MLLDRVWICWRRFICWLIGAWVWTFCSHTNPPLPLSLNLDSGISFKPSTGGDPWISPRSQRFNAWRSFISSTRLAFSEIDVTISANDTDITAMLKTLNLMMIECWVWLFNFWMYPGVKINSRARETEGDTFYFDGRCKSRSNGTQNSTYAYAAVKVSELDCVRLVQANVC